MTRRSRLAVLAVAALTVLATAACSDDSKGSKAPSAESDFVKQAQALVEASLKKPTFDSIKPKTPAPPFPKGKKIAIVMSTARTTANQLQARGFADAAAAVGWTTKQYDGQGTNQGKINAMRTALAEGAVGVFLTATDQRILTDPMKQAFDLGKPVVSSISGNAPGNTATNVFADASVDGKDDGRKIASWIIADAAANQVQAKIIWFENRVNEIVLSRDDGMDALFKQCGSACDVLAREQYTSPDVAQAVPQRIQAVLQTHPDANYVVIDVGPYAVYATQGIKQLGGDFAKKIKLASFDCVPDQVKRISDGDVDAACSGIGSEYAGWAGVDEMNRAFNKQQPAGNTLPAQLITKDTYTGVTDAQAGYTGGFDYKSAWKQFWGVS